MCTYNSIDSFQLWNTKTLLHTWCKCKPIISISSETGEKGGKKMEMRDLWQGFNEHKHLSRLPEIARSISCLKKEKEKKGEQPKQRIRISS